MVHSPTSLTSPGGHAMIHPDKIKTDRAFVSVPCSQQRNSTSGSLDGDSACMLVYN